jgi:hypothetical protein
MVLKLLEAYRLGATTKSIEKVIEAFTGESFEVEELFKSIGTYYDVSDRHAIRIGVKVAQTQAGISANVANDVARVRDLVVDLYTAIDLAKPAHVGINLTTVMGLDEDIDAVVMAITDELRIFMLLEELSGDPMLHQSPFLDPKTPDTGRASDPELVYQWFRTARRSQAPPARLHHAYTTLTDGGASRVRIVDTPAEGAIRAWAPWSQRAILDAPHGHHAPPRATRLPAPRPHRALVITPNPSVGHRGRQLCSVTASTGLSPACFHHISTRSGKFRATNCAA